MNNILRLIQANKLKILTLVFSIVLAIPTFSQAVSVPVNYTGSWSYRYNNIGMVNCVTGGLRLRTDFGMYLDKQFILQAEGVKNLDQNESTLISPGVNLVAYNYPVTGSYWYSSADYATPPMDGQVYNWDYDVGVVCRGTNNVHIRNQMSGGVASQPGYTLTSNNNNIIDCSSGNRCTTKGDGTAVVTVSFPNLGSYYVQRDYQIGNYYNVRRQVLNPKYPSCRIFGFLSRTVCEPQYIWEDVSEFIAERSGSTQGAWNYSLSPITYTVTVKTPNQAPTVNYNNTSNISYNTATANWSYTDPEGDPQTNAAIEIATDSGYSNRIWTGYAGTASNIAITGLTPGTTYYPRVAVYNNINGWTLWKNGPAFTTQVNNPPNLDLLKCGATSGATDYTRANINWNYTGIDEPGDELVLKARYKRPEDAVWTTLNLPYNSRAGNVDIANLISGFRYDIQVSLNDNRNSHLGDRWKGCDPVTPPNYPEPQVSFDLKSGANIAQTGGTLTIKTAESVNASWSITTAEGVKPNSCSVITNNISGGVAADIFDSNVKRGLAFANLPGQNIPVSPIDQTYTVALVCEGKDARIPRNIVNTITLRVESYPTVSCRVDGSTTVKAGDTDRNITANIGNVAGYSWEAGVDNSNRDKNKKSGSKPTNTTNPDTLTIPLTYVGTEFGRYNPWIKITRQGVSPVREVSATCGRITNLGDSNIREVR